MGGETGTDPTDGPGDGLAGEPTDEPDSPTSVPGFAMPEDPEARA